MVGLLHIINKVAGFGRATLLILVMLPGTIQGQSLVPPSIETFSPSRGTTGTTFTGTITGTNLDDVTSVNVVTSENVTGGGVTVTILSGRTSTSLPVQIAVASDATVGFRHVTVTAPAGRSNFIYGALTVVRGGWSLTGSLAVPRGDHTATLLLDGTVLVVGGGITGCLASAELYNPTTGTWSAAGFLTTGRCNHTATLLPNGKVLVAGGASGAGVTATAEIYDPTTRSWTALPPMQSPRTVHTATLLPNGKVLVVGGYPGGASGGPPLSSAELFDPDLLTWSQVPAMPTGRTRHAATVLTNGKILIAGGLTEVTTPNSGTPFAYVALLFDPISNLWTPTGAMGTGTADHTALVLPDGRVLVAGGNGVTAIYDPVSGNWSNAGAMTTPGDRRAAVTLSNGNVLSWAVMQGSFQAPIPTRKYSSSILVLGRCGT